MSEDNLKTPIYICMGSSCFSKGSRNLVDIINNLIEQYQLQSFIDFRGKRCFDKCAEGPNLQIGDTIYNHVTPENISSIILNYFNIHENSNSD
ncbi:MAG: (2Fe-2S) ferredoxin domain-containing protein [Bacteroidales bacterium]|jgi:NADH:ubiquinone oxidoreductase subunit E|nr:(2Fe-2S) ferredoxin domain-containing protein [Bacteroidales bacterium]